VQQGRVNFVEACKDALISAEARAVSSPLRYRGTNHGSIESM
jgi:hypothetical protein